MELTVDKTSPYAQGYIVDYGDGTFTLERPENAQELFNAQAGGSYYTTVFGDMIDALSKRFYGSEKNWHIIATANPQVEDFMNLKEGTELYIPSSNQFEV